MQVEDVARVGLAAGRAAQQQRDLPVGPGVLGQVVVDDQHVLAARHELLGHRAAGVGGEVLERGGVGAFAATTIVWSIAPCRSSDADDLGDLRRLLADGDVDADDVALLLVDDRVERDGASCRSRGRR